MYCVNKFYIQTPPHIMNLGYIKKKKKKVIGIFSEESNGQKKKDSGMFKLEEEGHIQKQEIERLRTKKLNFSKGCRVDISMPYFRKGVQKLKFGISTKSL